jgi:hypothetical protein
MTFPLGRGPYRTTLKQFHNFRSAAKVNLADEAYGTEDQGINGAYPIELMVTEAHFLRLELGWETGIEPATFGATDRRSTS